MKRFLRTLFGLCPHDGWRYLSSHEVIQAGDYIRGVLYDAWRPACNDEIGRPIFILSFHHKRVMRKIAEGGK